MRKVRDGLLVFLATGICLAATPVATDDWRERLARVIPTPDDVQVVRSAQGVAATLNIEASKAAVEVMEAGGNAMDAAVAAWLVLGVVTPNMTGLGAGGFINYYDAESGQTYFIDGNVRAGQEAHPAVFLDDGGEPMNMGEIRARGMAVGVPGLVRAFDVGLKKWGTRYFDELSDHAIRLAEEGWEVDRELSQVIHASVDSLDAYSSSLYVPDGNPLEPGDLLIQTDKARALRLIADRGSDVFYHGEIAEALVRHVQGLGGLLTMDDFRRFNVSVHQPLWVPYGDYWVATNPNILGGHTMAAMLRVLEPFDFGSHDPRSVELYHLLLQAIRVASAESNDYFADPEFVDRPWQALRSEEFVERLRSQIHGDEPIGELRRTNPWSFQPGSSYRTRGHHPAYDARQTGVAARERMEDEGTDHFTIVDGEGNIVSATTTLGDPFNAGHKVPEFGFMLNVRGGAFDLAPGGAHEIRPGKRPQSTMTPTIVFEDGEPIMTVGSPSPGGMQHVQVLLYVLEHGMNLAQAIAEPRVMPSSFHLGDPRLEDSRSIWEDGISEDVLEALRGLGHPMADEWGDRGAVSVLLRDGDAWLGAADPRRDGVALAVGGEVLTH